MEEDIKILEKMIDLAKRTGMDLTLAIKIENLLKRYKELEEENKNQKEALNQANKKILAQKGQLKAFNKLMKEIKEDVSKDSSSIKINAIKYQGYLEGYAERDRLAKEEYEECLKIEKNAKFIPISVIQNRLKDINNKEKEELKGLKGQDRYFVKQMYQYMRKPLQELLEERNK